MTFAISVARQMQQTAYLADLNMKRQNYSQSLLQLFNQSANISMKYMNQRPVGANGQQTGLQSPQEQAELNQVAQMTKIIELQLRNVDTQVKAVEAELESVNKSIDSAVKGFRMGYNASA